MVGERGYIALGIEDNAVMADVLSSHRRRRVSILNDVEDEIDKLRAGNLSDADDIPLWRSGEGKFVNKFSTKKTWM